MERIQNELASLTMVEMKKRDMKVKIKLFGYIITWNDILNIISKFPFVWIQCCMCCRPFRIRVEIKKIRI